MSFDEIAIRARRCRVNFHHRHRAIGELAARLCRCAGIVDVDIANLLDLRPLHIEQR